MRTAFLKFYAEIRASYWFIPLVLSILAAILSFVLVWVDHHWQPQITNQTSPFFATQADGARALLSAVGGSMIGVAGTVFSVTIAAVVYASGSYGPRLLTNFMNDRGNQFTLGTFTATFVYSILVLRTVRAEYESGGVVLDAFVPVFATFGAMVLALCSIGVLIYFIHHVPSNIHISNVVAGIGRKLLDDIEAELRAVEPGAVSRTDEIPSAFRSNEEPRAAEPRPGEIRAEEAGYIQIIDEEGLIAKAHEHDVVVKLRCRPGDFLYRGRTVFEIWPGERLNDDVHRDLLATIAFGAKRTSTQDILFLFDELVEIAVRALSPGVNDPFTAVTCLDWLGAAVSALAGRQLPEELHADKDGRLRLIGWRVTFAQYLEHSFGNMRSYAAADPIAGSHHLAVLARIADYCRAGDEISALRSAGRSLADLSRKSLAGSSLAAVETQEQRLLAILDQWMVHISAPDTGSAREPLA